MAHPVTEMDSVGFQIQETTYRFSNKITSGLIPQNVDILISYSPQKSFPNKQVT
jgi:hypothetical protein